MFPAHVSRRVLWKGPPMSEQHDLIPNFTQFPNKLMDYVIPLLRESEEKVLIYVLRCTYGYQDKDGERKEQDYISYGQFIGGQVSKEGKLLNFGAGVSRAKLAEALAFHHSTGLIERLDPAAGKAHAGRGATGLYRLNRHCEMVHFLNQCLQDPETAREKMVHFLNQKRRIVQKVNHSLKKDKKDKPLTENGSESEPFKNGSESEPRMVQKVNQPNKEKERKDSPPIIPPKSATPKKVITAIPDDFQPRPQDVTVIEDEVPTVDWLRETRKFIDHDRTYGPKWKDHPAAWRNWMRSADKRFDCCRKPITRQRRFVE